ncbi:MAG: response regulator [Planctomycetaceae bacterium]|nr:response regulator [Planctomycetaceae bacterium]
MIGDVGREQTLPHMVLLVDDDVETADSTKALLQSKGCEVYVARDGGQAQSIFVMRKPDFVILELILPNETGFEVCERMKQTNDSVPILIVTAIDMEDSRNLASRVGADEYLVKPVEGELLIETVREVSQTVWEKTHLATPKEERRIRFNCRCGKRFKVSPVHRGRTLTCPDCGEPLVVPPHE